MPVFLLVLSMIRLNASPLELSFDGGRLFVLGKPLSASVRRLGDLEHVLFDSSFLASADLSVPLYFMYRDLYSQLKEKRVRYDVTIILPFALGQEFNKTLGHYHPPSPSGLSFTEVYQVLHGCAHYLLQKRNSEGKIADVVLVKAEVGDVIVVPPGYGHVTINPSSEPLVMANLVCDDFESVYDDYQKKRGAAYFELATGELVKNARYGLLPEARVLKGEKLFKKSILQSFLDDSTQFDFLTKPETYSFKL